MCKDWGKERGPAWRNGSAGRTLRRLMQLARERNTLAWSEHACMSLTASPLMDKFEAHCASARIRSICEGIRGLDDCKMAEAFAA